MLKCECYDYDFECSCAEIKSKIDDLKQYCDKKPIEYDYICNCPICGRTICGECE
jgi:hypothetical protein